MRYLVTGATGFLGGHVVDALLEAGHRVRAHVLEPDARAGLEARGVEVRVGDLVRDGEVASLVEDVDVVVHCAGIATQRAAREEIWRVNVDGTKRLLEACSRTHLSRFVYISSVAVYGHSTPPVSEDAPKKPVNHYGESKWAAEEALWDCRSRTELPAVVLRPCLIYGERDQRLSRLFEQLRRLPVLPLPNGGNRIVALVHVSDVVAAILAASTLPQAVGNAYNVTDGERHTYRDVLGCLGEIAGIRPKVLPVPGSVFSKALEFLLWLTRRRDATRKTRDNLKKSLRIFRLDSVYSLDKARADLRFSPRVGVTEGLKRTFAWSRGNAPSAVPDARLRKSSTEWPGKVLHR